MKTQLLRNATFATLLLVAGVALAQGPGRHAAGRGGPGATDADLAYGAGYQARRRLQADREGRLSYPACPKPDGGCVPGTTQPRLSEPARAPEPARRDTSAANKP